MKVQAVHYMPNVVEAGRMAAHLESFGYDAVWIPETQVDAFIACAVAAGSAPRIELGTGIAVALARNPMTVAMQANDLVTLTGGRFVLGLGAQIKPHIERRFSMRYDHPAPRMREFVLAMRAIWQAWATGGRLDFRGDFYTHTLMNPMFDPGPNQHGNPPVILAAVGPKMTEVAGEVADGIFCHAFSTERYLREVTMPALQRGAERAGRDLSRFEVTAPGFVAAADSEEELSGQLAFIRKQIGFYGSTPAYRPVLELHGHGGVGDELNRMTKQGAWDQLDQIVDDDLLALFTIAGTPEQVARELAARYGDVATRVNLVVSRDADPARWAPVFETLRHGAGATPA